MNYILIYFILFILILVGIYWILKKIIKTILLVGLIFIILTAFLGYATYLDVKELSQRIQTDQNAFLLVENNNLLTGITFNLNQQESFKLLSEQELNQNIKELLKTNFKVITLDIESLEQNLPQEIIINEQVSIPKDQYIAAIKSEDPLSEIDLKLLFNEKFSDMPEDMTNEELKEILESESTEEFNLKDKSNVRALLLASSIQSISQNNPFIFLKEYKRGNIKIYKETITFKILKSLPISLIEQFISKIPQSL